MGGLGDTLKGLVGLETDAEKAAKDAANAEQTAAKEKVIRDKKSLVTEQQSIQQGQQKALEANAALADLADATDTGASRTVDPLNVVKRKAIGG